MRKGALLSLIFLLLAMAPGLGSQNPPDQAVPVPQPPAAPPPPRPPVPDAPATPLGSRPITFTVGKGELVQFNDMVDRVSISDPAIADVVVITPHEVVINAKSPGNTTAMIWHGGGVSRYELTVQPDLSEIQRQLQTALPNEKIQVSASKDAILLTGVASDAEMSKRAAAVAGLHAKNIVNLVQTPPPETRQVMLQVKFATIDRTALSQLGVNLFSTNPKMIGVESTQQFQFPRLGQLQFQQGPDNQPKLGNQQVSISDILNLFAFRPDLNFGATIRLLQERNLLEILAEPNLVTVSGHQASFLAGGEFPYPVISTTGTGGNAAPVVTVQFRKFGVQLTFTPTVDPITGVIHLQVAPEVSALDFSNALTIQGFLIPAISSRTAETSVDLREGETFAIAGLIDNRVTSVVNKIPGIGNLPIIGKLFSSRSLQKSNTELLVLVTPRFVKPFAAGETVPSLDFPKSFLDGNKDSKDSKDGKDNKTDPAKKPTFAGPRGTEGK